MKKLDGKVVILTGASRGLGKQAAIRLARDGAKLALCARNENGLAATRAACEEAGAEVLGMAADVTRYEDLKAFVDATVTRFGRIDVLVNNAITIPDPKPFEEQDVATLDSALRSGVHSMWHMLQLCFPHLKASGGAVVNFGAGAATQGLANWAAYSTAKAAIVGLSLSLAKEWGVHGIRVNILCPAGLTDSSREKLASRSSEHLEWAIGAMSRNALRRVGDPLDDIAPVVAFLASDDSRFMTGQTLHVDGGICTHA